MDSPSDSTATKDCSTLYTLADQVYCGTSRVLMELELYFIKIFMCAARRQVYSASFLHVLVLGSLVVNTGSTSSYLLRERSVANVNVTVIHVPLLGSPNKGYCAYVTVGTPANQEFCVLIDTGSANLAIAGAPNSAITSYYSPSKSSTSYLTGQTASVQYSVGSWSGVLVRDRIMMAEMVTVAAEFTMITQADSFYISGADWVGILGMAYENIAAAGAKTFWPILRTAANLRDVFAIKMCPPLHDHMAGLDVPQGGEMLLGGYNTTYYKGDIYWTSIVDTSYYKVLITNLTVGNSSIDLPCNEYNRGGTIVDSGTTDVYFPVNVFKRIKVVFEDHFKENKSELTVPTSFWDNNYKLAWPTDALAILYQSFPCFYVSFASDDDASTQFSVAVTPQMYLREVEGDVFEQAKYHCYPECTFLTFGIRPRLKGTVLSSNLMIGYLCVFDRENRRMGFAASTCTYPDAIGVHDQPHMQVNFRDPVDCSYRELPSPLQLTSFIFGGLIVFFTVVGISLACLWRRMTKICIKWYYQQTFTKKLRQCFEFFKFKTTYSTLYSHHQFSNEEETTLLDKLSSVQSDTCSSFNNRDDESVSISSYAPLMYPDNQSVNSLPVCQPSPADGYLENETSPSPSPLHTENSAVPVQEIEKETGSCETLFLVRSEAECHQSTLPSSHAQFVHGTLIQKPPLKRPRDELELPDEVHNILKVIRKEKKWRQDQEASHRKYCEDLINDVVEEEIRSIYD